MRPKWTVVSKENQSSMLLQAVLNQYPWDFSGIFETSDAAIAALGEGRGFLFIHTTLLTEDLMTLAKRLPKGITVLLISPAEYDNALAIEGVNCHRVADFIVEPLTKNRIEQAIELAVTFERWR